MLEELRRRNYAESTIHVYIQTVEHFSRHFHRSPDQLGPEQIRQYQAALFTRWKLAPNMPESLILVDTSKDASHDRTLF
ncbi:MAG TPA: phage integrase N-terminal SAM-like domain-containing protein [Candidatus Polarisedimenticolia bacterium]|nr:phage integrase N-terminal SAM-like domain-containing protein [Candidatus Polarisedimenticolia bacterium]